MIAQKNKYLAYIIFLVAFLLLFFLRWHSLDIPYFWDEMGVYGFGVQHLFEQGNGIFPKALPPEISRGHPLLFYSLHTAILQVFGNSFFVSHLFALVISVLCLFATYKLARVFLPRTIASLAVLLLVVQNIFLAQSALVLPEMLVALLSTGALYFFAKNQYVLAVLFLILGVWVKESVILTAAFLGAVYLLQCFTEKKPFAKVFLFTLPLVAFLIFLVIQKNQNGWYFFPYHTELISSGVFEGLWDKLDQHLTFILFRQGRNLWLLGIVGSVFALFSSANKKVFILYLSFAFYSIFFFSLAFYMDRYLLYVYPVLSVVVVAGLYALIKNRIVFLVAFSLLLGMSISDWYNRNFRFDVSMSYESIVAVQKDAINDFCSKNDSRPVYMNFPINMAFFNSSLGYVSASCVQKVSLTKERENSCYLLLYEEEVSQENIVLVQSYQQGEASIYLYRNLQYKD